MTIFKWTFSYETTPFNVKAIFLKFPQQPATFRYVLSRETQKEREYFEIQFNWTEADEDIWQ